MDLISQIQNSEVELYGQYIDSLNKLAGNLSEQPSNDIPERAAKLSVTDAHALSQLAQIGFPGLINITTPVAPVLSSESLTKYLQHSYDSVQLGKEFYIKIRTVDYLMGQLPDTFESEEEYNELLRQAVADFDASRRELYEAEQEALKTREEIDQLLDFSVNELSTIVQDFDPAIANKPALDTFDLLPATQVSNDNDSPTTKMLVNE